MNTKSEDMALYCQICGGSGCDNITTECPACLGDGLDHSLELRAEVERLRRGATEVERFHKDFDGVIASCHDLDACCECCDVARTYRAKLETAQQEMEGERGVWRSISEGYQRREDQAHAEIERLRTDLREYRERHPCSHSIRCWSDEAAKACQTKRYATIVADPPWQTMAGPLRRGVRWKWGFSADADETSQPLDYESMNVEDIAALPVDQFAAEDAALYLWTTNGYVEQAYGVARAWGFKPSTLLTWAKAPMGHGLGGAFGITSEYVLYARRGSPVERRVSGTWFQWKRHYINGKPSHSSKPDAFYDLVEQVNDGPYVDLFARRHRLGWDVWGNQSANTAQLTCQT